MALSPGRYIKGRKVLNSKAANNAGSRGRKRRQQLQQLHKLRRQRDELKRKPPRNTFYQSESSDELQDQAR